MRPRHALAAAVLALLLGACEGGSGQSGTAFVFLTVDGFSLDGTAIVSSIPSSTSNNSTTGACVTLRNNPKNPLVTGPLALDNVTIRSYTVSITPLTPGTPGGTFTFGTAVLIPAGVSTGTGTNATTATSTQTFAVVLVPAGTKGPNGGSATVQITFKGRDGRGQSVETEGAVTVFFSSGLTADSACKGTAVTPTPLAEE